MGQFAQRRDFQKTAFALNRMKNAEEGLNCGRIGGIVLQLKDGFLRVREPVADLGKKNLERFLVPLGNSGIFYGRARFTLAGKGAHCKFRFRTRRVVLSQGIALEKIDPGGKRFGKPVCTAVLHFSGDAVFQIFYQFAGCRHFKKKILQG